MNSENFHSIKKQLLYYKSLAENTFNQVPDEALFWQYNKDSNSIATIVKHLSGNMQSRWTDIFTSDGEKEWRDRDSEFENDITTRDTVIDYWNKGWDCFLGTLDSLKETDFDRIIYIRNQGHTVIDAILRQLAHYPYHVGQIVYIGKMVTEHWQTLSIAKGESSKFNKEKFDQPKSMKHFTDEYLDRINPSEK